ncbi:hypothetical protein GH714_010650 [Hevea brasiliensis]|uniref:glucan endo-1,3-beta-D-glucosidase n=1 Tax=Hevea brasiliensis TaxID=3981 RepID=A0A6A6MYA4_HEVBR|nr:hypothetical protein GH714_010650 [Hevea brasiliensis]
MYDAMLDAVHSAMKKLGYGDVDIVVGETGWPSLCDPGQPACSAQNAVGSMEFAAAGGRRRGGELEVEYTKTNREEVVRAKASASVEALQANIDYVCSQGVDCRPIQAAGVCFDPNSVWSHASFVMNSFYQTHGARDFACDFSQLASSLMLTQVRHM